MACWSLGRRLDLTRALPHILACVQYRYDCALVNDRRWAARSGRPPGPARRRNANVTHEIGNMVGYALAAQYPDRITKWVVIDAPLPGIGPWDEILKSPLLWHFNFRGPDVDRLVKGRERIYLDRFYNELSADPKKIDEATRNHYAKLYARPGNMHYAFEQFAAFNQDAKDNKIFAEKKLTMPILALGAEKSFGDQQAAILRDVATNVQGGIITGSGHWIMEEQPAQTVSTVRAFLDGK
jgi:pimeloyl-ACP methyl ester carboxylesterase